MSFFVCRLIIVFFLSAFLSDVFFLEGYGNYLVHRIEIRVCGIG